MIDTSTLGQRGVALEAATGTLGEGVGLGDLNGDGLGDIALRVVALEEPSRTSTAVLLGRRDLEVRQSLAAAANVWVHVNDQEANGKRVSLNYLGDLNSDGYADLWIGHPSYGATEMYAKGRGFLIWGGANLPSAFAVEDVFDGAVSGVAFVSSEEGDSAVGQQAASIGDFDGDGRPDLAISASRATNPRDEENAGALFILSDVTSLSGVVDLASVGAAIKGTRFTGAAREVQSLSFEHIGYLGGELAPAGDFDGDGLSDVLVMASQLEPQLVYLIRGQPDWPAAVDLYMWEATGNITVFQEPIGQLVFGGMDGLGDVNGDGFDDLVIGVARGCCPSPQGDSRAETGYVIYGHDDPPVFLDMTLIEDWDERFWRAIRPIEAYAAFSFSISGKGDLNHDGIRDVLIGAPGTSVGGKQSAGEVYAVYLEEDMPQDLALSKGFSGLRVLGEGTFNRLGTVVSPVGDFNGDGAQDLLALAPHASSSSPGPARAYVLYGEGDGTAPLRLYAARPASAGIRGGETVTLTGSGFDATAAVHFGDTRDLGITVVSSSELRVVVPPASSPGAVDLVVTVGGVSERLTNGFEYTPNLPAFDLGSLDEKGFILEGEHGKLFTFPAIAALDFGDMTGDGVDDLIVEATEPDGWRVFVVRGGNSLPQTLSAYVPSPHLTTLLSAEPRSIPGATVRMVGDVNGRGSPDLGIGAADGLGYLIFGESGLPNGDLDVDDLVRDGKATRFHRSGNIDGRYPIGFAPLGDLSGDGISDLLIGFGGAPAEGGFGTEEGEILLLEGRAEWASEVELPAESIWARIHGVGAGQAFAFRSRQVGDVNGDGLVDVLADTAAVGGKARAVLVFGARDHPRNASWQEIVDTGGGSIIEIRDGFESFDWFSISEAGDVNADGFSDMLLGVEGGGESFQGITYLVFGGPDLQPLIVLDEPPSSPEGFVRILGEGSHEFAGRPGSAGDFNADGYADVIIGAPGFQEFLQEPGNVFIVFGGSALPPTIRLEDLRGGGIKINGRNVLGGAGSFSGPSGDLNGDGFGDVAFSENAVLGTDKGHVYVLFSPFGGSEFIRGDANADERIDLSDAVHALAYLFLGGAGLTCEDAADSDDDGALNISDPIYLLGYLFLGSPEPPAPFPLRGSDRTTEDSLTCQGF